MIICYHCEIDYKGTKIFANMQIFVHFFLLLFQIAVKRRVSDNEFMHSRYRRIAGRGNRCRGIAEYVSP